MVVDQKTHRIGRDRSYVLIQKPPGDHIIFRGALVILLL